MAKKQIKKHEYYLVVRTTNTPTLPTHYEAIFNTEAQVLHFMSVYSTASYSVFKISSDKEIEFQLLQTKETFIIDGKQTLSLPRK